MLAKDVKTDITYMIRFASIQISIYALNIMMMKKDAFIMKDVNILIKNIVIINLEMENVMFIWKKAYVKKTLIVFGTLNLRIHVKIKE